MSLLLAQAAVNDANIHFDKLYSYRIPAELAGRVFPGSMVLVPFGRGSKARMAVVLAVGEVDESDAPKGLKTLYDAAPEDARLTPDLLELVRFLKERTFCTWFEAVKAVIPYGAQYRPAVVDGRHVMQGRLTRSTERLYTLAGALPEKPKPGPRQLAAVAALQNGPLTARQLDEVGISRATLDGLVKKGVLTAAEQDKAIDLFAAIPFDPQPLELSPEQQQAFNDLLPNLEDARPHAALLHGVTGSGKTIVFLRLIQRMLELGRRALVLVPEISLTPQMIRRLKSTFGSRLAVQHSALNNTERLLQWRMIQQGNADIVVGTRSAVFAPLQNLGLIIMDEEQEHTYRSEKSPRYDAGEVARLRTRRHRGLCVLASATPSIETAYRAQKGEYLLARLTRRYGGAPLPEVTILDLRDRPMAAEALSEELCEQLLQNLQRGEQSILFVNRRGYSATATCMSCHQPLECPHCSISLKFHAANGRLMCHYCGYSTEVPKACPHCGSRLMRYSGVGTQKVEEALKMRFPTARILRMDQDTTMRKDSHQKLLSAFGRGDYDILIGTQMVTKGLDFPRVTLVGVLTPDQMLYADDFRSYERTFSLITQVVGRSGRRELPGRAFLQTYQPDHPVLTAAARQDYPAFYKTEVETRRLLLYPPFCRLYCLGFWGENEAEVKRAGQAVLTLLERLLPAEYPELPVRLLGLAPAGVLRVAGRYRYKLLIKGKNSPRMRELLWRLFTEPALAQPMKNVTLTIEPNYDSDL